MKKLIPLLCAFALAFSLAGCQAQNDTDESTSSEDYSNSTLTGQVTAIDGTTITLLLGELSQPDITVPEREGGIPAGPFGQGENNGFDQLLTGDEEGSMSEFSPDGADGEPPAELPGGEGGEGLSEFPGGEGGEGLSEFPGGEGSGMAMPETMTAFTAGEETVTIDLSGASVSAENMDGTTDSSIDAIAVDDILVIEVDENNRAATVTIKLIFAMDQMEQQPGGGFDGSAEIYQGTSANTIDTDGTYTATSYTSTGDDENALRVDGAEVTLEDITVDKQSGETSDTESGDFYGVNAALLATGGANVTIDGITVTSSAQNGNGVFSYGEGTVVNISDSTITTTADNSGGIQTTGGGTTNAGNLDVTTSGSSSAAIRSDRGGGTVNVDGGTYTSNGYNSPAIYSTAAITVKNAVLTANNSEALVIEGANSMALEDCTVYGCMSDTMGASSEINVHNVMIYQSMSGDADVGTSVFSMQGGSLTSGNGDMFYVTNTHCILTLSGVEIVSQDPDGYLLLVSGNDGSRGWGSAGANGAQVAFCADGQIMEGRIAVDTISTLDLTLTNGSVFTGSINIIDNEQEGAPVGGNAAVTIDSGCTWNLTDDCTLTSLTNNGTINFNGYSITLTDGTVLTG